VDGFIRCGRGVGINDYEFVSSVSDGWNANTSVRGVVPVEQDGNTTVNGRILKNHIRDEVRRQCFAAVPKHIATRDEAGAVTDIDGKRQHT